MSTTQARAIGRATSFYQDAIGKKAVMAVTGVILFGYVIVHLLGNLQIFAGPEVINGYAALLRSQPELLWGIRIVLLVSVVLHIVSSVQLTAIQRAARPVKYARWKAKDSSYASRTMMWSGPLVGAFVVYHLLHMTFGSVHPSFDHADVYHNLIAGLSSPPVAAAYAVAVVLLGIHLRHGLWSMFQSMGFSHPRHTPRLKTLAAVVAAAIVIGYLVVPLAVLTGMVG